MSQRAYAQHRGVHHSSVQLAIQTKRISVNAKGLIDAAKADREWNTNTDVTTPRHTVPEAARGRPPKPGKATKPAANGDDRGQEARQVLLASRATQAAFKARRAEFEFNELSGSMLPRGPVLAAAEACAMRARRLLQTLPAKMAGELTGQSDVNRVRVLLEQAVDQVCDELAKPPQFGDDDE